VTVVDGTGRRFPMRGMEGQTLVEVLENQAGPLDVSDCESCAWIQWCCAWGRWCTARCTPKHSDAPAVRCPQNIPWQVISEPADQRLAQRTAADQRLSARNCCKCAAVPSPGIPAAYLRAPCIRADMTACVLLPLQTCA
jgi:hypothetical protein